MDKGGWARKLPKTAVVNLGTTHLYILHDLNDLDLDPRAGGFAAVIAGHSHHAMIEERNGVLYFNPGSAGPHRFHLPATVGRLTVDGSSVRAQIVTLAV